MESNTLGTAINVILVAISAVGAGWRGYHRRKDHWTRGSWIGLTVVALAGIALLMVTFRFAIAVDNHEAWVGAPHSSTRNSYALMALGAMLGGVALAAGSLSWFAIGDPARPFPLMGSIRRAPVNPAYPDHPKGERVQNSRPSA